MRTLLAVVLVLAIPTFAAAQQQADPVEAPPVVQLEQSTPAPAAADAALEANAQSAGIEMETRESPTEEAAAIQEPGSRNWWWIVGAVVVGGLIVVLLT